jgi:membrane associated rhomboid family serine protease
MSDQHDNPQTPIDQGPQPIFLLPGVVSALAGVMIVIHLASTFVFNEDGRVNFALWFGFIPVRLLAPDQFPGGLLPLLWTPITHAFLHQGWEHLLGNVAWLLIFGTPVARRYGAVPTLVIFLASCVVGALAFAATTLPAEAYLIGASGGIAGLTGAAIRFIFQPELVAVHPDTGERVMLGRQFAGIKDIARSPTARNFALIWIVLNGIVPLLPLLIHADVQIAWQAHLGGFFTGFFLAPLFERRPPVTPPVA